MSFATLIQNFNRFIWEQVHQETQSLDAKHNLQVIENIQPHLDPAKDKFPSVMQQVMGIPISSTTVCQSCGDVSSRHSCAFTVDLGYFDLKVSLFLLL